MALPDFDFPAWTRVNVRDLIQQTKALDHSAHRPVEEATLYNIERQQRILRAAGRRLELPRMYLRLLKLERAVMRHYPHLPYDDRLAFIAANATDSDRLSLMPFTPREVTSILDEASAILAVREALGMPVDVGDFSEGESRHLHRRYMRQALRAPARRAA